MVMKRFIYAILGICCMFFSIPSVSFAAGGDCPPWYTYKGGECQENPNPTPTPPSPTPPSSPEWLANMGIIMSTGCMKWIGCGMDIDTLINLKSKGSSERTSVLTVVQDAILAATFFIGTVVTIAFLYCGWLFIMSGADDSSKRSNAQKGMINAAIGMVLVMASYAIIRLVQFLASGG